MGDSMRDVISAPAPGLDLGREYGHHQSPAIRAGGLIFCSGMVAINPESGEREHGTVTSETRRIFEDLKLVLESAGSSLDRLAQVHAMIYDRIEYDVLNRVYRKFVPNPNAPPARTVMSVQIEAGFKVMLDVIAAAERRMGAPTTLSREVIAPGKPTRCGAEIRSAAVAGHPRRRLRFPLRHGGDRSRDRRAGAWHGSCRDAADPEQHGRSAGSSRLLARQSRQGERADLFDAGVPEHELGSIASSSRPIHPPERSAARG
jgi:2-iminobutanoate/2-iminopropanoate deaminase